VKKVLIFFFFAEIFAKINFFSLIRLWNRNFLFRFLPNAFRLGTIEIWSGKHLIWVNFWEFFLVEFDQKQGGLFFCFTSAIIKSLFIQSGRPQLSTFWQKSRDLCLFGKSLEIFAYLANHRNPTPRSRIVAFFGRK
jgi:hypothetical protein